MNSPPLLHRADPSASAADAAVWHVRVLDNCEQLDDACAAVVSRLAERLPAVHWLVTSRRPLGLDGEQPCVLEGLPLPAPDAPLAEVAMNPAVSLSIVLVELRVLA